ncbi:MAG: hypothetical protein GY820_09820 [Gammaproteobacteria bacterium]|nr:hypothetical protein [Gammaproteobacteria bacterium]
MIDCSHFRILQGFMSRARAEKLLERSDRAAMLIRFSDHHKSHLTISYIDRKLQPIPTHEIMKLPKIPLNIQHLVASNISNR